MLRRTNPHPGHRSMADLQANGGIRGWIRVGNDCQSSLVTCETVFPEIVAPLSVLRACPLHQSSWLSNVRAGTITGRFARKQSASTNGLSITHWKAWGALVWACMCARASDSF